MSYVMKLRRTDTNPLYGQIFELSFLSFNEKMNQKTFSKTWKVKQRESFGLFKSIGNETGTELSQVLFDVLEKMKSNKEVLHITEGDLKYLKYFSHKFFRINPEIFVDEVISILDSSISNTENTYNDVEEYANNYFFKKPYLGTSFENLGRLNIKISNYDKSFYVLDGTVEPYVSDAKYTEHEHNNSRQLKVQNLNSRFNGRDEEKDVRVYFNTTKGVCFYSLKESKFFNRNMLINPVDYNVLWNMGLTSLKLKTKKEFHMWATKEAEAFDKKPKNNKNFKPRKK